jgi:hypothetical protein
MKTVIAYTLTTILFPLLIVFGFFAGGIAGILHISTVGVNTLFTTILES